MQQAPLAQARSSMWFAWIILTLIVAQFCARNLPLHLDDYDQAKQAYTSFEMVELGHWWFQHTPRQDIATKPPLAGWISAAIYLATRSWELAWRLPSLLSALAILALLWRAGASIGAEQGGNELPPAQLGLLAAGAFGLNAMAPRLATLVRTDMLLTLFIFLIGYIIFERLRVNAPWSTRERWAVFALVLGSMMIKGPIVYAFLLPGLVAFYFSRRRLGLACRAWSGWWTWLLPLLGFAVWAMVGLRDREFYEQVVLKEFLGRFTTGEHAVHKSQPVYFYLVKLLLMFAPWSVLLIGLAFVKNARAAIASRPALLWLLCWALGGLLFMSFVPSKRADRIFPIIPPLCLTLVWFFKALPAAQRLWRWPAVAWINAALVAGILFSGGYTVYNVTSSYRSHEGTLREFGERARAMCAARGWRCGVLSFRDEGILLYLRQPTLLDDAEKKWKRREVDALILTERDLENRAMDFPAHRVLLESKKAPEKSSRYFLIVRADDADAGAPHTPPPAPTPSP